MSATGLAKTWKKLCKGLSRKCFSAICRPCYQYVAMFSSSINYKVPDSSMKHNWVYLDVSPQQTAAFLTLQFCSLSAAAWIKVILEEVTDEFTIFHIWVMILFKSLELLFGTKFATSVSPSVFWVLVARSNTISFLILFLTINSSTSTVYWCIWIITKKANIPVVPFFYGVSLQLYCLLKSEVTTELKSIVLLKRKKC